MVNSKVQNPNSNNREGQEPTSFVVERPSGGFLFLSPPVYRREKGHHPPPNVYIWFLAPFRGRAEWSPLRIGRRVPSPINGAERRSADVRFPADESAG